MAAQRRPTLYLSAAARRRRAAAQALGRAALVTVASIPILAVLFVVGYVLRDAWPFFQLHGAREFFTSPRWYPTAAEPEFGALAMFVGSALVTLGAGVVAVPMGVAAAICLSDVLPFGVRQFVKPAIEMLAAIPSVVYGFFALVVVAPILQRYGGTLLELGVWIAGLPVGVLGAVVAAEAIAGRVSAPYQGVVRRVVMALLGALGIGTLAWAGRSLSTVEIASGTNALNVSIVLGIMALPTVVSVSEDALQAVGRELREGSYALGATRAETILRIVLPAASGGITAAVILGVMRAFGETMVVWMASGNSAQIPSPWYNFLSPVRTLTATIAGEMGEADHVTGSARYHVLFAMASCLLVVSLIGNLAVEAMLRRRAVQPRA